MGALRCFNRRHMLFVTPRGDHTFEIPHAWWLFAELPQLARAATPEHYRYTWHSRAEVLLISLIDIQPPVRRPNLPLLEKNRLMPILFAFSSTSPDSALPPIEVRANSECSYRYRVFNGYHRYYASVAVGFRCAPVILGPD